MKKKVNWHVVGLISLILLALALFFTVGPGMQLIGFYIDSLKADPVKTSLPFDLKCYPLNANRQYRTALVNVEGSTVYSDTTPKNLEPGTSVEVFPNHIGEYYLGVTVGESLKADMKNIEIIGFIFDPNNPNCSTVWWHIVLNQDSQISIHTK